MSYHYINIKADGVTDDTNQIQKALDASSRIIFPPDKTVICRTLHVYDNHKIDFNGCTLDRGSHSIDTDMVKIVGNTGIRMMNGIFRPRNSEDNTAGQSGFSIGTLRNSLFDNITVNDSREGFFFGNFDVQENVTLRECNFNSPIIHPGETYDSNVYGRWGVIFGIKTKNCIIERCNFKGYEIPIYIVAKGEDGNVRITQSENNTIRDNTCEDSSDTSIYIYGKNNTIKDNKLYRCGKDGIKIKSGFNNTEDQKEVSTGNEVIGNHVEGAGRYKSSGSSLIVNEGTDTVIKGNRLKLLNNTNLGWASTRTYAVASKHACIIDGSNRIIADDGGDCRLYRNGSGVYADDNPNKYVYGVSFSNNYVRGVSVVGDIDQRNFSFTGNRFERCRVSYDLSFLGSPAPLAHNFQGNQFLECEGMDSIRFNFVSRMGFSGNVLDGKVVRLFNLEACSFPGSSENIDNTIQQLDEDDYVTLGSIYKKSRPNGSIPHPNLRATSHNFGTVYQNETFCMDYTNGFAKLICTDYGTGGTLEGGKGNINASSSKLTVIGGMDYIHEGNFLVIEGAGSNGSDMTVQVVSLDRDEGIVTLSRNANTTVSDATINYKTPSFKEVTL